ncbi:hypothetical protein BKI52_44085 [marine bacterium AO1-C]|nr:hypothetical protein BKI52_44085 [marine bacterium AO1-C]
MKRLKQTLLMFLFLMSSLTGIAQNINITGKVIDQNKEPLLGVQIIVQDSNPTQSTTTDDDGNFSINVPTGAVLTFLYVGFETQSIKIDGTKTILLVKMKDRGEWSDGWNTVTNMRYILGINRMNESQWGEALVGVRFAQYSNMPLTIRYLFSIAAGVEVNAEEISPKLSIGRLSRLLITSLNLNYFPKRNAPWTITPEVGLGYTFFRRFIKIPLNLTYGYQLPLAKNIDWQGRHRFSLFLVLGKRW